MTITSPHPKELILVRNLEDRDREILGNYEYAIDEGLSYTDAEHRLRFAPSDCVCLVYLDPERFNLISWRGEFPVEELTERVKEGMRHFYLVESGTDMETMLCCKDSWPGEETDDGRTIIGRQIFVYLTG